MAIALDVSHDQDDPSAPVNFTIGSGTNRFLLVSMMSRTSDVTAVKWNTSENCTKIGSSISSSNAGPAAFYSIWFLINPSNATSSITVTGGGVARFSCASFTGVDQTTGYNTANPASSDFTSVASPNLSLVVANANAWIAGQLANGTGSATADSNTAITGANQYITGWTPTAQSTGSHEIGLTTTTSGVFHIVELIPFGAAAKLNKLTLLGAG